MPSASSTTVLLTPRKLFDLVPRDCLWKVLKQRGMAGRVLSSLQSMYSEDRSCVLISEGAT